MSNYYHLIYLITSHLVVMATGLNNNELAIVKNYTTVHGRGGHCTVLGISEPEEHPGFLELRSSGIPNHPSYKLTDQSMERGEYVFHVPKTPFMMKELACVPQGLIGLAINGVPIYSPLTEDYKNGVQGDFAERFDGCHGKVDSEGRYHYKELPALDCLFPGWSGQQRDLLHDSYSVLIGVALDGFPIYYLNTTYFNWSWFTELLDPCHGTKAFGSYRYYITEHFPYTIGCLRGEVYGDLNSNNRAVSLNQICAGMNSTYESVCICGNDKMSRILASNNSPSSESQPRQDQGLSATTTPQPTSKFHIFKRREVTNTDCHFSYSCRGPMYTEFCSPRGTSGSPRDCTSGNKFGGNTCTPKRKPEFPNKHPPIRGDVQRNQDQKGSDINQVLCKDNKEGSAGIIRINCPSGAKIPGRGGPKPPPPDPNRPGSRQRSPVIQNNPPLKQHNQGRSRAGPPSVPNAPPSPQEWQRLPMHLDGKVFQAGRPSLVPSTGKGKNNNSPPSKPGGGPMRPGPQGSKPQPVEGSSPGGAAPNNGIVAPPGGYISPKPPGTKADNRSTAKPLISSTENTKGKPITTSVPTSNSDKQSETDASDREGSTVTEATAKSTLKKLRTGPPEPAKPRTTLLPPGPFPSDKDRYKGTVPPLPDGYLGPQPPSPSIVKGTTRTPVKTKPETQEPPIVKPTSVEPAPPSKPQQTNDGIPTPQIVNENVEVQSSTDEQSTPPSVTTLLPPRDNSNEPSNNGFPGPPIGYVIPKAPGSSNGSEDDRDGPETNRPPVFRPPVEGLLPTGPVPGPPSGPPPPRGSTGQQNRGGPSAGGQQSKPRDEQEQQRPGHADGQTESVHQSRIDNQDQVREPTGARGPPIGSIPGPGVPSGQGHFGPRGPSQAPAPSRSMGPSGPHQPSGSEGLSRSLGQAESERVQGERQPPLEPRDTTEDEKKKRRRKRDTKPRIRTKKLQKIIKRH